VVRFVTLAEAGIDKNLAKRARQLAALPEDKQKARRSRTVTRGCVRAPQYSEPLY
jgi:hypothetical protein